MGFFIPEDDCKNVDKMIRLPRFVSNVIGPYFANPIWWRIRSMGKINVTGDTILVDNLYKFKINNRTEL